MLASYGIRTVALLAAVALSACSDDDSGGPPDDVDGLPEFTAGDAQVPSEVRTAIVDLLGAVGANSGGATDPELAGVLNSIGGAVLGEGRISGVTAGAALRGASTAASLVDGTWGVFGAAVSVYPDHQQAVRAYYTIVVALNKNEVAIGLKKANTEQEIFQANAVFPHSKAMGLLFQGRSRGWGAVAGYTQVIPKSIEGACAGTAITGIVCQNGTVSAGLEIDASVPLSFSGNAASGTRQFALPYGEVRGYRIDVYCDEASFC